MPILERMILNLLSSHSLNGWGLTIVDSLDTMLLMGLDEEFEKGMEFVHALDFKAKVPSFSTLFSAGIDN